MLFSVGLLRVCMCVCVVQEGDISYFEAGGLLAAIDLAVFPLVETEAGHHDQPLKIVAATELSDEQVGEHRVFLG